MMGFREYLIETADPEDLINGKGALARYVARQTSIEGVAPDAKHSRAHVRISEIDEQSVHVG